MVTDGRMAHDFSRLENLESGIVREDIIRYPARREEHRSFETFLICVPVWCVANILYLGR